MFKKKFKDKIEEKKINEKDLSFLEDAITIIIDLTHSEWHSVKSYWETNDARYLKISEECRKDRSELLDLFTKKIGENWCLNKHLFRVIGGYVELGNREYSVGNEQEAIKYYNDAKKYLGVLLKINDK